MNRRGQSEAEPGTGLVTMVLLAITSLVLLAALYIMYHRVFG